MIRILLALTISLMALPASAQTLVIAHRGASGERPEHTRAAYELAIDQGADFIEPDLVMSRDGVLVVRHENALSDTTDVADRPEFADRRRTQTIDGGEVVDWFSEDFTLAELRTLRARERLPDLRSTAFDGQEGVLTFEEVLDLADAASARTGRRVGVIPELKHPSHFAAVGLPMEAELARILTARGLAGADAPVIVQSFEVGALKTLDGLIEAPLMLLASAVGGPADLPGTTYASLLTDAGLAEVATYADWIGVETSLVVPRLGGASGPATDLPERAHAAGLKVGVWTLRAEDRFLPSDHSGDLRSWFRRFEAAGVDAVFTDNPGKVR
ncbi:glycerophosphodiester phosphodiesterase [Brevundimonas sp.]|jgi:glycerophosphoryl diester phosphodiesterase|uniref:glycerophosphodiester phosphodiesterase n=1 Tax=Brevundimonas sp. TaxID=1871086 RepID=UPI002E153299|nr:glycerophosphodiester phosphodiesterase [Brevundimonas sp.]